MKPSFRCPSVLLLIILLVVLGCKDEFVMSQQEIPDFSITRARPNYQDLTFQVGFEQQKQRHLRFQVYNVVIAIRHERRNHLAPKGYLEVWRDKKFIFSCAVPQRKEDSLGLRLKKKVETENAMLFFFQINPRYIHESWFTYQALRGDGSAEMNCVVRLKDFIVVADDESPSPTAEQKGGP